MSYVNKFKANVQRLKDERDAFDVKKAAEEKAAKEAKKAAK